MQQQNQFAKIPVQSALQYFSVQQQPSGKLIPYKYFNICPLRMSLILATVDLECKLLESGLRFMNKKY